jgi:hypothetical protein
LLVHEPRLLADWAHRQALRGHALSAELLARSAWVLRPTARLRFWAAVLPIHAGQSAEQRIAALRALAAHATPEQQLELDMSIAAEQHDWAAVLQRLNVVESEYRRLLSPLVIRAHGELGHIDEMMRAFVAARADLTGLNLQVCNLYVLAFAGRSATARRLLNGALSFLRTKDYWSAIAERRFVAVPEREGRRQARSMRILSGTGA